MITAGMLSSKTPEWATPQGFFDKLDAEFHFTLDPCCTHENAKCENHYTVEDDGLSKNWGGKWFIAILRMAENSPSGSKNATMRQCLMMQQLLCSFLPGLIQRGSTITSTARLR